jgi:hypothetical protein
LVNKTLFKALFIHSSRFDILLKPYTSFSKLIMLRFLKMNLINLRTLIGMRERPENLNMNEFALADLDLDEEVGASDNLGSDGDRVEVCEFLSCLLLNVMS